MKLYARDSVLDLSRIHVMGILNITPDSFSDAGKHNNLIKAVAHANNMIDSGATIVDVGGESTRPGATEVSVEQELERVIPVVGAIAQRFEVWISVDTSKPEVMLQAACAGAHIINDIRSLQKPGALDAAASTGLPVCLVHMQGEPRTMQLSPHYQNVLHDVNDFFITHIERCITAGIKRSQLLLDPGFGFGKKIFHNYLLLAHLSHYHHLGLPLLVGMSRKSMVAQLLNDEPSQRLTGSITCAVIAAMQGAHILRVHDVKETVEAMRIVEATRSARKS